MRIGSLVALAGLAAGLALVALPACGGGQDKQVLTENAEFKCRQRRVAYIATGHFAGREVGVVADCAERGPRIRRWIVIDDAGGKQTGEHSLSVRQFNTLWEKIDSTGWRNLEDCEQTEPREGEPGYKFGIKDDNGAISLACAGRQLPFPFDRLANELDLLVAEHGL